MTIEELDRDMKAAVDVWSAALAAANKALLARLDELEEASRHLPQDLVAATVVLAMERMQRAGEQMAAVKW